MSTSLHPRPLPGANNPKKAKAKAKATRAKPMPWLSWNVKLAPQWALSLLAAVRREVIVLHPRVRNQLPRQPTPMLSILIWMRIRKVMFQEKENEHLMETSACLIYCLFVFLSPVTCILYTLHPQYCLRRTVISTPIFVGLTYHTHCISNYDFVFVCFRLREESATLL
jgi:hypothetical protein